MLCRRAAVGIDANNLGAAPLRLQDKVKIHQSGIGSVAAPQEDELGIHRVGVFMATRPEISRGWNAKAVLQSFGHAVVDAASAVGRAADGGGEALHRALG